MNHDEDDALFRRALDATTPHVDVPSGFAERVSAQAKVVDEVARPKRSSRRVLALSAAAAALLAGTWGYTHRRIEGVLVARDMTTEVHVGNRAVAVLSPGTSGSFAVGGLFANGDTLQLDHGTAFLRVERGAPFSVVTEEGRVDVLGTCFEVTRMEEDMNPVNETRSRWFGAGAVAMGMFVAVYEGSVHVSHGHADAGEGLTLHAGEQAYVDRAGEVRAMDSNARAEQEARAAERAEADAMAQRTLALRDVNSPQSAAVNEAMLTENTRLRAMLEGHAISPETGEFLPNARRGLDEDGNTDLTPEEWTTLAQRGELRFRLPGNESGAVSDSVRTSVGMSEEEAERFNETARGAYRGLTSRVGDAYQAATGRGANGRSLAVMMSEIEDHTAADETAHVRWLLSQERAGTTATPSEPMSEYERMMRELVGFESGLEQQVAAQLGAERAHRAIHESSAHSFGMTGHPRSEEAPQTEAP